MFFHLPEIKIISKTDICSKTKNMVSFSQNKHGFFLTKNSFFMMNLVKKEIFKKKKKNFLLRTQLLK